MLSFVKIEIKCPKRQSFRTWDFFFFFFDKQNTRYHLVKRVTTIKFKNTVLSLKIEVILFSCLLHLHEIVEELYFHFSLSVCVCLYVCLSVCLSVSLSVSTLAGEPIYQFWCDFRYLLYEYNHIRRYRQNIMNIRLDSNRVKSYSFCCFSIHRVLYISNFQFNVRTWPY